MNFISLLLLVSSLTCLASCAVMSKDKSKIDNIVDDLIEEIN